MRNASLDDRKQLPASVIKQLESTHHYMAVLNVPNLLVLDGARIKQVQPQSSLGVHFAVGLR
jgi:hypothetical protein